MSTKSKATPQVPEAVVAETPAAAPVEIHIEHSYEMSELRRHCRELFGVSASTFDAATYGMTGRYTVEELKSQIESWQKKGVK